MDTLPLRKIWLVDGAAPKADVEAQAQQFRDAGWVTVTVVEPSDDTHGKWVILGEGFQ